MDKKTKMVLGVAAIGTAAYLYFKSTQPKTGFANATGKKVMAKNSHTASKKKHIVGDALFAQQGKFAKNLSGDMHMMPDGSMMKNSAMNLSGTVEAHQSKFNASGKVFATNAPERVFNASGKVFAPTATDKVFSNIVGDALVRRSTNWA
jgi:hypothetical protein